MNDVTKTPAGGEIFVKSLHFANGVDETYTSEIAPRLDVALKFIKDMETVNG